MTPFGKNSVVRKGIWYIAGVVLFTIVANLVLLGLAVWVVVMVLKATGVLPQ